MSARVKTPGHADHCNCEYCYEARGGKSMHEEHERIRSEEFKKGVIYETAPLPFGISPEELKKLQLSIQLRQRQIVGQMKNDVSIEGDQITINGITRTLTNPPRNRKERKDMIAKIKANLLTLAR